MSAPKQAAVAPGAVACQLLLEHRDEVVPQSSAQVTHRIENLTLKPGATITAFVLLDGRILGSASIVRSGANNVALGQRRGQSMAGPIFRATAVAGTRPPLTSPLCQAITVRNTPQPGNFTGPTQALLQLGVIDDLQARAHKQGIQQDLNQIGWNIQQKDIQSGPANSVRDCSDSVENNAF